MQDLEPVDRFIAELRALCPVSIRERVLTTAYGQKFALSNGCRLVISCTHDRAVSKLHAEQGIAVPGDVVEAARSLVNKYTPAGSRQRRLLFESIDQLARNAIGTDASQSIAPTVSQPVSPTILSTAASESGSADPLAAITAVGTIGIRRASRSGASESPNGLGGPSGWSQAIGHRCERFAFEWIGARFGVACVGDAGSPGQRRLRIATGDRLLIWLNAESEQENSWDIEERDATTGEILRRHEVKARTGELTASEHALAIQYGDAYMIWRVDPDAGVCERLQAPAHRSALTRMEVSENGGVRPTAAQRADREASDISKGPTLVVLGSSTRDFCRRLLRRHSGHVGRYRGNLVVAFPVTPELQALLPPSKSRSWVANRSRAGCARLAWSFLAADHSTACLPRQGLLLIGLLQVSEVGLARCIAIAIRHPKRG